MTLSRGLLSWICCTAVAGAFTFFVSPVARGAEPATFDADKLRFFDEHVKPLLQASCLKCHGAEAKIKGSLRLTTRDSILKGGDTGPAVAPDAPEKSLLLDAINYRGDLEMPPKQKLPPEKIEVLTKWVKMGLPWPAGLDLGPGTGATVTGAPAVHVGPPKPDEWRDYWSFRPVARPGVPEVKNKSWVRNSIDAFVLAKLEAKGFAPAPPADKVALIRRATYDLTGLPPSASDVDAFVNDASPDAYEKLIDRLLASPHYGEKWGRYWLDLVRFAETNSYERDNPKPNAWRYRDYVIRSFNQDKPYDRFVKEQLAGDELPDSATNPDDLIATGYYRLGIWDDEPTDKVQARYDALDDIVATTGQVFLGVTIDCARCHDHKIDPIPQTDYYRLLSFFHNIAPFHNGGPGDEAPILTSADDRRAYDQRLEERKARRKSVEREAAEIREIFRQLVTGEPGRGDTKAEDVPRLISEEGSRVLGRERFAHYRKLLKELDDLGKTNPAVDMALSVSELGPKAPDTFVLVRGNANVPGQRVEPGFLTVLGTPPPTIPEPSTGAKTCGRRSVLADWIASKDNPLTARVMVNRIWQYHFGRGLVRSPNNFGLQGDRPTHPELLDWLASEFTGNGWQLKAMHKLIMTSNAYRMSCRADEKALAADPQNDLLWRFDLRRLTAEEIRDSVLAVNGTLNRKMYGPSIYPPIPREVMAGQSMPGKGWETSDPSESARRSVYVHVKRSLHVPIIENFDMAETDKSCPVRFVTVQPTQALGMINGTFMNEAAAKLAKRLRAEAGDDVRKQVALALRLATCRTPTDAEIDRGVALVNGLEKQDGATREVAMKDFSLMVLNLNEFVYLD